jgi:hypothetical protein
MLKMSRADAIILARMMALKEGSILTPSPCLQYLPKTAEEAAQWFPHEWVIDAVRYAHKIGHESGAKQEA